MALHFIELELLPMVVLHSRRDFQAFLLLWP